MYKKPKNLIFSLIFITLSHILSVNGEETTLEQVHVFFRHGDRTTHRSGIYPKDPHINQTFFPYGSGELTKKGKQKAYNLGKSLRQRYNNFLGPIYTPDILNAVTSPYNRTISSLELVLAALFPPSKEEMFEEGLHWQPIPFYHTPKPQDTLFLAGDNCPNYQKRLHKYRNSKKMIQELAQFKNIFQYIERNSGLLINDYYDLLMLHSVLSTEAEWGLVLPKWTNKIYPNFLKTLAARSFGFIAGTTYLKKAMAGYFLAEIVNKSHAKINSTLPQPKLFLYSGHEYNIGTILTSLDIFEEHLPPYGAYIIIELHKKVDVYGIKIYYQNYKSKNPVLLKLPTCQEFCTFEQFVSLVEELLPDSETC